METYVGIPRPMKKLDVVASMCNTRISWGRLGREGFLAIQPIRSRFQKALYLIN